MDSDELAGALRTLPALRVRTIDAEVQAELTDLIGRFPSREEFYARLRRVGLGEDSEQVREIVRQRVAINKYIAFRFRFAFAVGAIAATLHDIFVTISFLAFFGYDLSLNVVADRFVRRVRQRY